jgi:hypothetical protein
MRQAAAQDVPALAGEPVRVQLGRPAPPPSDIAQDPRWTASNLPDSGIREEHARSGQWRDDAPAAVTGR